MLYSQESYSSIAFLRPNLQFTKTDTKANAYRTLVRPQNECASTSKTDMVKRRAAHFVCNNYRLEASVPTMQDELGWHSLKQQRANQRLNILYKIVNNLVEVDLSKKLIPLTRHSRNTHAKSFRIP